MAKLTIVRIDGRFYLDDVWHPIDTTDMDTVIHQVAWDDVAGTGLISFRPRWALPAEAITDFAPFQVYRDRFDAYTPPPPRVRPPPPTPAENIDRRSNEDFDNGLINMLAEQLGITRGQIIADIKRLG